jgi:uncharacterized protein with FMN-binding domain
MGDGEEAMKRPVFSILLLSGLLLIGRSPAFFADAESKGPAQAASPAAVHPDTLRLPEPVGVAMDRMEAMSVRRSVRQFQSQPVPDEKLSWLLRAAGSAWQEADPPGRMIVVRQDKAGRYDRRLHALLAEPDSFVTQFGSEAPVTITLAPRIGEAETDSLWVWRGAAGQALYLGAAALELGTVTRGGVRFPVGSPGDTIRRPPLETPGEKTGPGRVTLESSLRKAVTVVIPSDPDVLLGDLAWAMYGRSALSFSDGRRHRTVASARNRYPMTLYVLSGRGVSVYDPEANRLVPVPNAESRSRIAEAAAFPALQDGPFGFLIAWDRAKMDNRGCALYEAGSMLFDARLVLNPLGIGVEWKSVSDPAAIQSLIPGIAGEPFFWIAVGVPKINPKKTSRNLKDGKYMAESPGWAGMKVEVSIMDGKIRGINVLRAKGSERFYKRVIQNMPSRIVAGGGPEIEGVTGATLSSTALKIAVRSALEQAERNGT